MDSPWLQLIFSLADRFGESDPRKIACLPAEILRYWEAWFSLTDPTCDITPAAPSAPPSRTPVDKQCADIMRILG
ncbi:hypothetical protein F3I54_01325 [Pantoea sp. VH_18]|uniref:Uncharacterized protein n=1 Tax=Candidatus Pantoea gossypiicola TaxID=2608008 RepID=A0AB34CRL1_9GAMM|nr:hypothetical protein F3I55_00845 [Pantoea sp. VH_24]KAA5964458.1 hypothetical protein F3I53_01190 [Pantoea sp. VH_16]KAA5968605.1 hypothetical protein F3I54_01325 [Pantoea sp. VH_18]KAA6004327.1 hypothetical protein F3I46_00500 [Pantoea sp. M_1]KAA6006813.1 hypothetical protein F3I45_01165 [Pantoea sp. F_7]KAA6015628.1 hypothetical protein F3I43_01165 [Pantoea sp. F_18]KAA6017861.1 hypothetical protein F3I44_01165 [Pantoea sp. F_5]KAA6020154.1 hypothetical protein F3I40_01165 [Pantoea sp.